MLGDGTHPGTALQQVMLPFEERATHTHLSPPHCKYGKGDANVRADGAAVPSPLDEEFHPADADSPGEPGI